MSNPDFPLRPELPADRVADDATHSNPSGRLPTPQRTTGIGTIHGPHQMYGKQTERAIAAMSRLAEVWDGGRTRLSANDIADQRGLPRAMVAKLLTVLSQAGLVNGSPGPGGGYSLARRPDQIAMQDVYVLFEREDASPLCPFGGGVCGVGEPCALHDRLVGMQGTIRAWLRETTFDIFRSAAQEKGLRPAPRDAQPQGERMSYRAPKHRGV